VLDIELISVLPLIPTTIPSRRASLLLSTSVSLEKSLHNPCGPLILVVDSLLPEQAILRILAGILVKSSSSQTLRKVLIT
jgi:hypothetical protein